MLITPPTASEPYSAPPAPFNTSTRSIILVSGNWFISTLPRPPALEPISVPTRRPSTKISTRSSPLSLIIFSLVPRPVSKTITPSTSLSTSPISWYFFASICSAPTTEMFAGVSTKRVSVLAAVTTNSSISKVCICSAFATFKTEKLPQIRAAINIPLDIFFMITPHFYKISFKENLLKVFLLVTIIHL